MTTFEPFMLVIWYVVFLLSLTCHEAAHAWAAKLGGDETAYLGGQVTLNPIPHMRREIFGTIIVPLISFFFTEGRWMMGWASAPYDPRWERRYPKRAAAMAAAGPAANLLLAAIAFGVIKLGIVLQWWKKAVTFEFDRIIEPLQTSGSSLEGVVRFLSIMLLLNLLLFVFNLLPLPPLDGGSVVAGLFTPLRPLMDLLRFSAFGPLVGILIAWNLIPYLFWPVFSQIYRLL